jgi:hypothetical protein
MENTKISFLVSTTNSQAELGFEAWLDDQLIFNSDHVQESIEVVVSVSDNEAEHVLKMVLKGKLSSHTTVNESGEIISDAMLKIQNITVDGIALGQIVNKKTVYTHDFNGSGKVVNDVFFENMGCNGTVELQFTTPIYLWMLENM